MKNFKKWTAAGAVVLALGLTSVTAFAAVESPAEIVAGLTGKSVEAVIAERTESAKPMALSLPTPASLRNSSSASLRRKKPVWRRESRPEP
jgi:hypothetical protein